MLVFPNEENTAMLFSWAVWSLYKLTDFSTRICSEHNQLDGRRPAYRGTAFGRLDIGGTGWG